MPGLEISLDGVPRTDEFGSVLARLLEPGDVLLLDGELGAGKTTLVHAVARAMGVPAGRVSSPTFTLMQEYEADSGVTLLHLDAYRLGGEDAEELLQLGWDEARSAGTVTVIEWGERVADLLGSLLVTPAARIRLTHEDETERHAAMEVPEAWAGRSAWGGLVQLSRGTAFASDREQWADLYKWMSGSYRVSRPAEQDDLS